MDHYEAFLALFDRDDLKGDSLEIIPDEYNSLVDSRVRCDSVAVLDDLETAVIDDI